MATYKEKVGTAVQNIAGDTGTVAGQLWYDSSDSEFKYKYQAYGNAWSTANSMNTARQTLGGAGIQTSALGFGGNNPISALTESWNGSSWTEIAELNGILSGGIGAASGTNTGRSADASARLTGGASSTVTDPIALRHGGTIVGSDRGLDINAEKKKTADLLQGTQEQTTGFLDNISGATVATFATVAAATGDFKTAMIATFAQMFLEIAIQKAVASFGAGAAHGGSVPFGNKVQGYAGGGSVVARRDRVPALLEPGEFVIRKPAAKAIGGSALNQLNATGKMNSGNNVVVNVQNNGTPQQVETTQVRTDTGQMIIDLVVKDIKNNGRVRKAMRG